jgi:hypothetical protein
VTIVKYHIMHKISRGPDRVTPFSPISVASPAGMAARSSSSAHAVSTALYRAASKVPHIRMLLRMDVFCTHASCTISCHTVETGLQVKHGIKRRQFLACFPDSWCKWIIREESSGENDACLSISRAFFYFQPITSESRCFCTACKEICSKIRSCPPPLERPIHC